jgi:predicted acetyltransferase
MPALEIRAVTEEEARPFFSAICIPFGSPSFSDEELEDELHIFEPDRSIAVFEKDRIVGTAGAYTFDLTVPGGNHVPVAGVTYVSVMPTHRRRGILRKMMTKQLNDIAARGESIAVLTASETIIYGRFGYGLASTYHVHELQRRHADFAVELNDRGRVDIVDPDTARKMLPDIHDRARRQQPGDISRRDSWWEKWSKDRRHERGGASGRFNAVHLDAKGEPDGYVSWRIKNEWGNHGLPDNEVRVEALRGLNPTAQAALWRFVLDLDLTGKVHAWNRPMDDPLRWMLSDPRRLTTVGMGDFLWLRILDVPTALSARAYPVAGRLVLDVNDDFRKRTSGRYLIDAGPDGVEVRRAKKSDGEPDLAVGIADLGAAYLGGVQLSTLASAGRVVELNPGALAIADALFSSTPQPWCTTGF